jgi:hypothetical protein
LGLLSRAGGGLFAFWSGRRTVVRGFSGRVGRKRVAAAGIPTKGIATEGVVCAFIFGGSAGQLTKHRSAVAFFRNPQKVGLVKAEKVGVAVEERVCLRLLVG